MARQAGKDTRVYIDEFNFTGRTNQWKLNISNNLVPVTCFGDSAPEYVEGLYGGTVDLNGFFDPADDNYDEQMFSILSSASDVNLGLSLTSTAAVGHKMYVMRARVSSEPRVMDVTGAILLNATFDILGGVARADILGNQAMTGGVVAGSNKNLGVTAAGDEFIAVVKILAVSGSGNFVIAVQESSDDGAGDAYSTILTSSTHTAIGSEVLSTTSATEAWKRLNVTVFTGFASVTALVAVGKIQGT